jgi:hypothetical protein
MLVLAAIFGLRMTVTNDNWPEMKNLSESVPVFGFFHTRTCGHCTHVEPIWANLTALYENDTSILLIDSECTTDRQACDNISRMPAMPTFVLIYNNRTSNIRVEDRSVENFVSLIEEIKGWDARIPCYRWFNQTNAYPYLVVSFPGDELRACNKLIELQWRIPSLHYRVLLGKPEEAQKVVFVKEKDAFQEWTAPLDDEFITFALDHLHPSIGSWPLEEGKYIVHRRLGLYIYNASSELKEGEDFAKNQSDQYAFTRMTLSDFQADYPDVEFEADDTPALAVFNKEQTAFYLMKSVLFDSDLKIYFAEMINAWDFEDPLIPRKGAAPRSEL